MTKWTQLSAATGGCFVFAASLPLSDWAKFLGMRRHKRSIARQLRNAGALGYARRFNWRRRAFENVSAWPDEKTMMEFTRRDPHRQVMAHYQAYIVDGVGIRERLANRGVARDWDHWMGRLEAQRRGK